MTTPTEMRLRIRERQTEWILALEGGEYTQCNGQLRKTEGHGDHGKVGFCCHGVACDLFDPDGWSGSNGEYYQGTFCEMPPEEVQRAFGLTSKQADMLADKNDGGATFADIATYLRITFDFNWKGTP